MRLTRPIRNYFRRVRLRWKSSTDRRKAGQVSLVRQTRYALGMAPLFGRYEAGERWSPRRSHVRGFVQDARFDADQITRTEIVRKSRYFERNNAIVNRLADLFEQYTVGPNGLQFIPAADEPAWNQSAANEWSGWCENCDLTSRQHFGTVQSLAARAWFVDGEVFILKTRGKDRGEEGPSRPRIQLIESHRVETPPDRQNDERIVDGIQVDERGRPVGYWVREQVFQGGPFAFFAADRFTFVPADQMIHIFEPSRPGMYRGLPFSYAVMNDLHDLDDLQILEMDAAKDAAQTSKVVKTKTGEMPMEDLIRNRIRKGTATDVDGTSGGSSRDREDYYKQVLGADAVVMRSEDDYEQFKSERPSVAVQSYWEHLISKVCAGHGISKLLVFPHSMQGTVTRADLDVANAFFRSRSAVLATFFTHVYHYWLEWAVMNIREMSDPPVASFKRVRVRPPRSVNVDVGRNSRAVLDELMAGVRTFEDVYGELGEDYTLRLRQRAKEAKLIKDLAAEFGVEPSQISNIAGEPTQRTQSGSGNPDPAEPEPGQPEPADRAAA